METVSAQQAAGAGGPRHVPAYRFGFVLLLLLATFIFLASGPTGDWVPFVAVVLQSATLFAAFAASGVGRRLWRLALVVVAAALVSSFVAIFVGGSEANATIFVLSVLLVAAAPVVIISSLVRRRVIDFRTVLGAVCVYVLVGMMFSFAFTAVGNFDSEPFFAQQSHATVADYLYFSFVTITTTGYGDLTAAHGLGRAMAVLEALTGQLYLVTVIAVLVSNIGRRGGTRQPQT